MTIFTIPAALRFYGHQLLCMGVLKTLSWQKLSATSLLVTLSPLKSSQPIPTGDPSIYGKGHFQATVEKHRYTIIRLAEISLCQHQTSVAPAASSRLYTRTKSTSFKHTTMDKHFNLQQADLNDEEPQLVVHQTIHQDKALAESLLNRLPLISLHS